MAARTKIYTVHVNADKPDPADRVELVREAFSLWAVVFHFFWLLYHRLWIAAAGYLLILTAMVMIAERFHFSQITVGAMQVFLQVMLGFVAHDLERWTLQRRGYHLTSVVAAETELHAQRRYYDALA